MPKSLSKFLASQNSSSYIIVFPYHQMLFIIIVEELCYLNTCGCLQVLGVLQDIVVLGAYRGLEKKGGQIDQPLLRKRMVLLIIAQPSLLLNAEEKLVQNEKTGSNN
ncbi:hypothetical protein O6H91_Y442400 [Diphasiastrum complanatum]|nr:hypothetical protein O6H91_Y442400 [Diphasiastrum complanatum]